MEATKELTGQQRISIQRAIVECDEYIAKEGPRNPALRPASEAQHLAFCRTHKAKLEQALATGVWVSKW